MRRWTGLFRDRYQLEIRNSERNRCVFASELSTASELIRRFRGVRRRFEEVGTWNGVTLIDDYAHHPTEVAATLEAARQAFPRGKVHAVFQPHLFSRTQQLAEEFGRALLLADHAVITDIYPSREKPIEGVHADLVVEAAKRSGHRSAVYCGSWQQAPEHLKRHVGPGDAVLTLGAGDVYRLGQSLVSEEEAA